MPQVLTTNAQILCPHGVRGESQSDDPVWSINGGDVLVEGDRGKLECPNNFPCRGYTLRSMGLNATQIKGKRVVLVTDFNLTNTGLPLMISESHRVIDNTTPAPIPDGQPAPPLSPAMSDEFSPVVKCPTVLAPYSLTSHSPVPPMVTFTLTSAHPLKWMLILIHEPGSAPHDLTTTTPPGVTVNPLGGNWDDSPLAISMTLAPFFLDSLVKGQHVFYMTGINQRGLSDTFVLPLTIKPV